MCAKTFKNSGSLSGIFIHCFSHRAISNTEALGITLRYYSKNFFIIFVKKIKTAKTATLNFNATTDFVDFLYPVCRIVNGTKKFDVPAVASIHCCNQMRYAKYSLSHIGNFITAGAISMFHFSVVFKKRNVILKDSMRRIKPNLSYILIPLLFI